MVDEDTVVPSGTICHVNRSFLGLVGAQINITVGFLAKIGAEP